MRVVSRNASLLLLSNFSCVLFVFHWFGLAPQFVSSAIVFVPMGQAILSSLDSRIQ